MQSMIRKIIEMDKEARRLTDEARERREGSARAIERKKSEVSENFLTLARQRVEIIRKAEMNDAAEQWSEMEAQYAQVSQRLSDRYEQNGAQWIDAICARVINLED